MSKSIDLILSAVKSAGDAALRLHEDNERRLALLRDCQDALTALEESYPELMDRLAAELTGK
jgi:hypothetical protein